MLAINADDMLDMRPHQKRQIDTYLLALIRQLDSNDKVHIIKIGDKMTDKLRIPKDIADKIESEQKYCTKPEFEMLIIMAEGLTSEYEKGKSTTKPKTFAKANVIYNRNKYKNSPEWINKYFNKWTAKELKKLLCDYKRFKSHEINEKYLLDLIVQTIQEVKR